MKKIKKLKLINWHFFENQEINFSDINVITGENGTGKSTILDAIHYLQSGGLCKFNTAANTISTGRNVENYVRGRIGAENREYLRPQSDVIAHIAIEYFDTLVRNKYVLGCVIQLSNNDSSTQFYEIKGSEWNENLFFNEKGNVCSFDSLLKQGQILKLNISRIGQLKQSPKNNAKDVRKALGVPLKYEILFSKALSFEPLNDINKFAMDFLLPEQSMDLSSIKGSFENYRVLQTIFKNELDRKELLEPIFKCKDKYETALKDKTIYELLSKKSLIQIYEEEIKNKELEIEKIDAEIKSNENLIVSHETASNKYSFEAQSLENDPSYNALKKANSLKEEYIISQNKNNELINEWMLCIDNESKLAKKIGTSLDLSNIIKNKNYLDYLNILSNYKERIDDISNENENDLLEAKSKTKEINTGITSLEDEIRVLEEGSYGYPQYVNALIDTIKAEILNKKGVDNPLIVPFCSLLDIVDEEWRPAVEGFLDRKRFDLFLNKKDYISIAKECFDRNPNLKDFFGVGVITEIPQFSELKENSLASKVSSFRYDSNTNTKSEMKESTNYLRFLLNDITCVDSVNDFILGEKAITKDGVYFDGKTIRAINQECTKRQYIGQESIRIRLEIAKNERRRLLDEKNQYEGVVCSCYKIKDSYSQSEIKKLLSYENLWDIEATISKNLEDIINRINELTKNNNDLLCISSTIEKYYEMAKSEKKIAIALNTKNNSLREKRGSAKTSIESSKTNKASKEEEFKNQFDLFSDKYNNANEILVEKSNGLTGQKLKEFAFHCNGTCSNQIESYEKIISSAMFDYNHKFPNELKIDINNYTEYVQRYNKIVTNNLARLNPDLESAKNKSVQELKEHFISQIRRSITEAKSDISGLNKVLKKYPFGSDNEVFEFYFQKTKDILLSDVYRIAIDTQQDTIENNIFTEELDVKSQETMQKVLELLSKDDGLDNDIKNVRKDLLDYRRYLNYDIKILINNGLDTLLYSKNQNSKSGGETQTPFYALIAAAFQYVLNIPEKNQQSPSSLVVFDEAFNNMDGERIRQMLEFYKELNIQLIISVPSSRFGYISPYADNIISLAKEDNNVAVFEMIKKGK